MNSCSAVSIGHSKEVNMETAISSSPLPHPFIMTVQKLLDACMHIAWVMIIVGKMTLILNADQSSLEERRMPLFHVGRLISKETHPWTHI